MTLEKAKFLTSVVSQDKIIKDGVAEIAFVGRSNVGKSSFLNSICGQKNLAKTSSTPGLTKMINYFSVGENLRLVDLPGYGYAKTGQSHIANWAGLMEKYLTSSTSLASVFVLIDCRHKPSELDHMMLDFLKFHQIPFLIVATKVDKLAKNKIFQACQMIAKELNVRVEMIFPFSANDGFGRDKIVEFVKNLELDKLDNQSK